MGFFKKLFGFGKKEEEKVDEEVIEEPIKNKEEVNDNPAQHRNFKYLDNLIHSGVKEIVLDSDIMLDDGEESEYVDGIKLDVDDLVIIGNRHTIDACGKTRVFYCTGKNITIKNITLKMGFAKEHGGAIYNQGKLTIIGSILKENISNAPVFGDGGGAIYNYGGTLIVSDSTLTRNRVQGVYGMGGAISNGDDANLELNNCIFSENTAESRGGAIHNGCMLTINESLFAGNEADDGGAICNYGELTIEETILQNNSAIYGGVIQNRSELTIYESKLTGNTAMSGVAIDNYEGNLNVFKCNFIDNKLKYKSWDKTDIVHNFRGFLQLSDCVFMINQGANVIINEGDLSNLSILNDKFKDNDITESVIFNDGKSCTIEKSIFENNHSNNCIINKSDLILIRSPKIKDESKILNEKNILIKKSSGELEDKIYGEGRVETLDKVKFKEFDFGYLDKKIHESKTKEIILEENISFENYEIDYYEGGIELDIDNLIIDGNGHTIDAQEKTRIFYCTGKNITLKNIIFKNGHSNKNPNTPFNNHGGAIKITHNANLTIRNCKFINNTSEENGGAINNDGTLTIVESTLSKNTSAFGGAILNSGKLTITDSSIMGNKAGGGGAINNYGELIITKSIINNNFASFSFNSDDFLQGGGGAIHNCGELTITDSSLTGNETSYGGAILNISELTITDSSLTGNTAKSWGGAIHNSNGGELTVSGSTLIGNTAAEGGAIFNWDGVLTLSESTLAENTVKECGGAIYNYTGMLIVSDSTLTGNTAPGGGAIYNWDGVLSVSDSTLHGNTAKGWTIYNSGFIRKIHNVQLDECIYNDGRLFVNEKFSTNLEKPIINKGHIITLSKDFVNIDDSYKIFELKSIEKNQKDFTYLNESIHSGVNEIKLKNDIILNIKNNEDLIFKKGIKIDRNELVIDGNGHIIDANDLVRIFYCTGKNITIKNIILKNGYSYSGGAIYNDERGVLTVSGSILEGNTAKSWGGAIDNSGELTVSESTLAENTTYDGGAIHNSNGGELTVSGSILEGNTAKSRGGAIYLTRYSKYKSNNCTFKENKPDGVYEEKD